jgi:hypothetical protein
MSTEFIGNPHDFDFLVGRWRIINHRLKQRHSGCTEWERFDATYQAWSHLDGGVSVDEMAVEGRPFKGLSMRTLDLEARLWAIHWIANTDGRLQPPVHGGWAGDRGEFAGDDLDDGRPVRVHFVWERLGPRTARWSQDFALIDPAGGPDGPRERNWVMDFERIDG